MRKNQYTSLVSLGEATASNVQAWLVQQPGATTLDIGNPPGFNLAPSQSQTVLFNSWIPFSGNYFLEVQADPNNIINNEYNESNNNSDRDIPELTVDGITVSK